MDYPTTVLLTLAALLTLSLLIIAGLVVSARAFTQLVELTRSIGSQVVALKQETQQALITSLGESGKDTKSAQRDDTPTTPENQS